MPERWPPLYNGQRESSAWHACTQRVAQFEVTDFTGVPSSGRSARALQKHSQRLAPDSPMGASEAGRVRGQRGRLHPAPALAHGENTLHEQRVGLFPEGTNVGLHFILPPWRTESRAGDSACDK